MIGQLRNNGGREVIFLERRTTIGEMFSRYQTYTMGKGKFLQIKFSDRREIN